jgi:glutathione S-transferase
MSDSSITLYRLQACPFCERAVRKLDDLGIDYRSRFVEARHSRRDVVKRLTGARTVPALVDERTGVTMSESANIVEYLDETYGEGSEGTPVQVSADAAGDDVQRLESDGEGEEANEGEPDEQEVEA